MFFFYFTPKIQRNEKDAKLKLSPLKEMNQTLKKKLKKILLTKHGINSNNSPDKRKKEGIYILADQTIGKQ